MTALDQGPCQNWPPLCVSFPLSSAPVTGYAVQAATEVLWQRTHRRFGLCEEMLRPCRTSCAGFMPSWYTGDPYGWPHPALIAGRWYNLACGLCGDQCSCSILHQITLPSPVAEIIEVKIDGAVLPASSYSVHDHRYLVRIDGEAWPLCNDLNLPDTEVGTWSINLKVGEVVPTLGQMAVGELASEIARACTPGEACVLPRRVQQVARQGVTKTFVDATAMDASWLTGLPQVDLFLTTFNPGLSQRAQIYDIDRRQFRRVGT